MPLLRSFQKRDGTYHYKHFAPTELKLGHDLNFRPPSQMKNLFKILLLCSALAIFVASCINRAPKTPVTLTASETPQAIAVRASDKTFKNFSHTIPEHTKFECSSCHRREGQSLDLNFAGHAMSSSMT